MATMKKRSMILGVLGAIASFGITSPVLAANRITLTIGPKETPVSITALERFAETGNISVLPPIFSLVPSEYRENLQKQLNRPISIHPDSPLDLSEQLLLSFLLPNSTEAEIKSALTLMAEKANGKTAINFMKELPGDTITPNNFLQSVNAYQPTPNPIQPSIRVSQESSPGKGDFDANILGIINPFITKKTAVGYYEYNTDDEASFNGSAPTLISNQSRFFLVDAKDGMSLFVVHDKPEDRSGGSAKMRFDLLGDTASLKLVDDKGEAQALDGGTAFTSNHNWSPCCTDGLVIGSLDNTWEMLLQFTATPTGLNSWLAYSSSGSTIPLQIETSRRVRLDIAPAPVTSVPEPGSMFGLLTFGAFGTGALLKRKQQQKALDSVATD